jgi:hypothetical protein
MLYAKFPGANKLMIVHGGHWQGFALPRPMVGYSTGADGDAEWQPEGMATMMKLAAVHGCDLLMVPMLLVGDNRIYAHRAGEYVDLPDAVPIGGENPHDHFPTRPDLWPATGHWLKYFVDPVLNGIDWMIAGKTYDRIGMTGVSGGGWSSTLAAALDPRIHRSYPVAGSVPLAFRREIVWPGYADAFGREGDAEQYEPALTSLVDYDDLYMMSVAEGSRRSHLHYTIKDPTCFSGDQVSRFASTLENHADLNGFGDLRFRVWPGTTHDFQPPMISAILADFLSA